MNIDWTPPQERIVTRRGRAQQRPAYLKAE